MKKKTAEKPVRPIKQGRNKFIAFYSYKGGVGRTLALANCAVLLAQSGRKVLALDFDLEAPGLDKVFDLTKPNPGVVDYLKELRSFLIPDSNGHKPFNEKIIVPDSLNIGSYIQKVPLEKNKTEPGGRLDFLCAGKRDDDYTNRLDKLAIRSLYQEGVGVQFFKTFKEKIRQLEYDYILIDARTGLSDIGIVCAYDLADAYAFVVGLNKQNIEGAADMLADIKKNVCSQPKVVFVASPVPGGEQILEVKRLKEFEARLGKSPDVVLYYHPILFFEELLFVQSFPTTFLTQQYGLLTEKIRSMVGDDVATHISTMFKAFQQDDLKTGWAALESAARINPDYTLPFLLHILSMPAAAATSIAHLRKLYKFALILARKTGTAANQIHFLYGTSLCLGGIKTQNEEWLNEGQKALGKAVFPKTDDPNYYNNYGSSLHNLGRLSGDRALFPKAIKQFEKAIVLKADDPNYYNNYGTALSDLGQISGDRALFEKAFKQFEKAIALKGDHPEYYNNYGGAVIDFFALSKDKKTAEKARKTLLRAERLKPGSGSFNLACLETLLGRKGMALKWLEKAVSFDPLLKETAKREADLISLRKTPRFKKITG